MQTTNIEAINQRINTWNGEHTQDVLSGTAYLSVGSKKIPVRSFFKDPEHSWEDHADLLADILASMRNSFAVEQYLILHDAPAAVVAGVQARMANITNRRLHAGTPADFEKWFLSRFGALAHLSHDSPVRALTEHLLGTRYLSRSEPRIVTDLKKFERKKIEPDFVLGQLGSDAVGTLFLRSLGEAFLENVEDDPVYQKKDIDWLVLPVDKKQVSVEVKTEAKPSRNIAIENFADYDRCIPGWFWFTQTDVLTTVFWKTGDVYFMDMNVLRAWMLKHLKHITLKYGYSKATPDKRSQCYLPPIEQLFSVMPEMLHLNIFEWMPDMVPPDHKVDRTWLPSSVRHRSIKPQFILRQELVTA